MQQTSREAVQTQVWQENVIHLVLSKQQKFGYIVKWYTHKQEIILEKETYQILWDFEIKTDHTSPIRKRVLVLINK